jgi:hypothetical protein
MAKSIKTKIKKNLGKSIASDKYTGKFANSPKGKKILAKLKGK